MFLRQRFIAIGNFFFRYRNAVFPLVVAGLYAASVPPDSILGSNGLEIAEDVVAAVFVLAGLALRASVIGFAYIKRGGVNKQVYADKLVTEGMFHTCRNPLYAGNMLIVVGLFIVHGELLVFVAGTLFFWFVYVSIIAAEESYLAGKFGADYAAYCREVPRWVPDLRRWRHATSGMQFRLRRVLTKDYGTIALSLSVLCLGEFYEQVGNYGLPVAWARDPTFLTTLLGALAVLALATLTISRMKKAGWLRERAG